MLLLPTARMHPTSQASTRKHEWHRRPRRSRNSHDRRTSEPNRLDPRVTLGTEPAASTASPSVKWSSCRHECDYSRWGFPSATGTAHLDQMMMLRSSPHDTIRSPPFSSQVSDRCARARARSTRSRIAKQVAWISTTPRKTNTTQLRCGPAASPCIPSRRRPRPTI